MAPKHIGIVVSHDTYIHAPGKDNTVITIEKIEDSMINNDNPEKIYAKNPIGFKRIILERDEEIIVKRRKKII